MRESGPLCNSIAYLVGKCSVNVHVKSVVADNYYGGREVDVGTEGVADNLTSHFQVPATSEQ